MNFDPVRSMFYTSTECCADGAKVNIFRYYKVGFVPGEGPECVWYQLGDGTMTNTAPNGLDCSCESTCQQTTAIIHSNPGYLNAAVGVLYTDTISFDGSEPVNAEVFWTADPGAEFCPEMNLRIAYNGDNTWTIVGTPPTEGEVCSLTVRVANCGNEPDGPEAITEVYNINAK